MGATRGLQDNIPSIVKGSSTTVTLAATNNGQPTRITVGGQQYRVSTALSLNTATSGALGGLDTGSIASNTLYYVYACTSSGVIGLVASTTGPTTGPTGFSNRYKLLGRFRTDFAGTSVNTVVAEISFRTGELFTDWQTFTPTISSTGTQPTEGTNTKLGKWRRNGGDMEIVYEYNQTVAGTTGTGNYRLAMPTGYTIDTTGMVNTASNDSRVGESNLSSTVRYDGWVSVASTNSLLFNFFNDTTARTDWGASLGGFGAAAVTRVGANIRVPIAEWAGLFT